MGAAVGEIKNKKKKNQKIDERKGGSLRKLTN